MPVAGVTATPDALGGAHRHRLERAADAVGIGALVERIQPRTDMATVLIDQMHLGEVPARVAHQHAVQVTEGVRALRTCMHR